MAILLGQQAAGLSLGADAATLLSGAAAGQGDASALALILLSLVLAVGIFEQQEI